MAQQIPAWIVEVKRRAVAAAEQGARHPVLKRQVLRPELAELHRVLVIGVRVPDVLHRIDQRDLTARVLLEDERRELGAEALERKLGFLPAEGRRRRHGERGERDDDRQAIGEHPGRAAAAEHRVPCAPALGAAEQHQHEPEQEERPWVLAEDRALRQDREPRVAGEWDDERERCERDDGSRDEAQGRCHERALRSAQEHVLAGQQARRVQGESRQQQVCGGRDEASCATRPEEAGTRELRGQQDPVGVGEEQCHAREPHEPEARQVAARAFREVAPADERGQQQREQQGRHGVPRLVDPGFAPGSGKRADRGHGHDDPGRRRQQHLAAVPWVGLGGCGFRQDDLGRSCPGVPEPGLEVKPSATSRRQ